MALGQFLVEAVGHLGEALRSGAYVQDPSPALYVYGLQYRPPPDIVEALDPEQRRVEYLLLGLVGSLDLDRLVHAELALHERTFADRVDERQALTDATGMNFAPIMAGYSSLGHRLNDQIEGLLGIDRRRLLFDSEVPPIVSARLDGSRHILWRIDEPSAIQSLQGDLNGTRLLVLDGHHRVTAAAKRHHDGRRTMPLVMLVDGGDRALQVLPWHRVIPGEVATPETVVDAARATFPGTQPLGGSMSVEEVIARLREMTRDQRRGFVIYTDKGAFLVPGPPSDDVGADFDVLHEFLEEGLRLDPGVLEFVRSPRQAIERTQATPDVPAGTAVLLPGITEKGIEERAFGKGSLMARKSTMFLPKVAEGMIFAPVDGIG